MNHRQRKAYSLAAIFGLLFFISQVTSVLAQNYTLNSLFSTNQALPQLLPAFAPTINNLGHVAYPRFVFDTVQNRNEQIIFIHDGTSETAFFNLTEAGFQTQTSIVINDNGAIAVLADLGPTCPNNTLSCLLRINSNQTFTVLATANGVGGGGDFAEFERTISMNNSGQVAAKVRRTSDGANQIVRIDGAGVFTEIAIQSAALILQGQASINDSGTVAFVAEVPNTPVCPGPQSCIMVFTGTGGALTSQGRRPPLSGSSGHAPIINNNGLVLDTGVASPALIYTAQGGVVNVLVVGNEDPVFTTILTQPSQNDSGTLYSDLGTADSRRILVYSPVTIQSKIKSSAKATFCSAVRLPICRWGTTTLTIRGRLLSL
jgi:hypothetical protein